MIVGYARTSTTLQDIDLQIAALQKAGAEQLIKEQVSAATIEKRPELLAALKYLRQGDTLLVTRLDRLARSVRDLQNIVHDLDKRGVAFRCVEQSIDTSTAGGKAFFDMLCVFAEFERNLIKERQRAGIEKAKLQGKYKGRPKKLTIEAIRELQAKGMGVSAIARELGFERTSIYREIRRAEAMN